MTDEQALRVIEAAIRNQADFAATVETMPLPTVADMIREQDFRLFIAEPARDAFAEYEKRNSARAAPDDAAPERD